MSHQSEGRLAAEERFVLPMPDGDIAGWHWQGDPARPLLFCHANGFCASVYRQVLGQLAPHYDVWAIDLRGHGLTRLPADPSTHKSWHVFANDIVRFTQLAEARFGLKRPWTLAGHSLGGVSVAMAGALMELENSASVDVVRLIEPVIMPRLVQGLTYTPLWPYFSARIPLVQGALSRRSQWPDRAAAAERYSGKRAFQNWAPGIIDDYLLDGLKPAGSGCHPPSDEGASGFPGLELSCEPAWEAANFAAQRHSLWPALSTLRSKVHMLVGTKGTTVPLGLRGLVRKAGVFLVERPDAGHLLPMEMPQVAVLFLGGSQPEYVRF